MTVLQRSAFVNETEARRELILTAQEMGRRGLAPGRSGNVSRRWRNGMLITPSGMPYEDMKPADIVIFDSAGEPAGVRRASSEWHLHWATYTARPDIGAIVHTHSMHAVVLACAGKSIPAFHYMVAIAGGDEIPCVPYATFGTQALAKLVAEGLKQTNACLMAHHGAVAVAASLPAALDLASEVETLAEQYYKVLTLGPPALLTPAQMAEVHAGFQRYGQNAQA